MTYYDISVAIRSDIPVWEGDPPAGMTLVSRIDQGDLANVTRLDIGAHTATHVDAPVHFVAGRKGIDGIDLDTLIGPAEVVNFDSDYEITAQDLERANIPDQTTRLLCKTRNSRLWSEQPNTFYKDFVGISESGAHWLVEHGIKLIGVDYLGVERFDSVAKGAPTHKTLLQAEMVIVEGLNLADVPVGRYKLICLPVKIKNSDGAPCRALLSTER